ncbi:MAG: hypothetical protein HWN66_15325 [Candidatus Helarchaeota archaeon]|nr:hypothetical protein [Candidatus Helarchaeota archaeon]
MGNNEVEWTVWREENQDNPLELYITELENGMLLIISDKGPRIGTIAMGIPNPSIKSRINTSSIPIVFGIRNELFSRAIAERVAHICQKLVIASIFLSNESPELAQRSLRFAEKSIREYVSKKRQTSNNK